MTKANYDILKGSNQITELRITIENVFLAISIFLLIDFILYSTQIITETVKHCGKPKINKI